MTENNLLTTKQVATWLNTDEETVRRMARKGQIEAYRVGRDYRFQPAAVQEYLERQLVKVSSDGN